MHFRDVIYGATSGKPLLTVFFLFSERTRKNVKERERTQKNAKERKRTQKNAKELMLKNLK